MASLKFHKVTSLPTAIASSDTINQAIGKLVGAISGLETLLASI